MAAKKKKVQKKKQSTQSSSSSKNLSKLKRYEGDFRLLLIPVILIVVLGILSVMLNSVTQRTNAIKVRFEISSNTCRGLYIF